MKNTEILAVSLPSDCEIVLKRVLEATRQPIHDAFSKPEISKRWLGSRGFRFVRRESKGRDLGMRGVYRLEHGAAESYDRPVQMPATNDGSTTAPGVYAR